MDRPFFDSPVVVSQVMIDRCLGSQPHFPPETPSQVPGLQTAWPALPNKGLSGWGGGAENSPGALLFIYHILKYLGAPAAGPA